MTPEPPAKALAPWWLLPLLLATVLVGMIGFRFAYRPPVAVMRPKAKSILPSDAATGDTVSLVVDFGNGAQRHFEALEWEEEVTVLDLMLAAEKFQPGIEFTVVGTGESAFLTSIECVENDSSGGRFWQYWVNDSRGDRSFGIYPLKPGDHVLWKFAPQE